MTDACVGALADAFPAPRHDHAAMTRSRRTPTRRPTVEERTLFDALCFMRALYAERGPQDSVPVASMATVMAAANGRLGAIAP
jgi:hypothetical protein